MNERGEREREQITNILLDNDKIEKITNRSCSNVFYYLNNLKIDDQQFTVNVNIINLPYATRTDGFIPYPKHGVYQSINSNSTYK